MIIDSNRSSQILASMIYDIRASDPPPGLSHKGTWRFGALRGASGRQWWNTSMENPVENPGCSHWGVLDSFSGV